MVLCCLGVITGTLNVLGYRTISEHVRAAVEHSPELIGLMVAFGLFLSRVIWRRRERLGWVVIFTLGLVVAHWGWWR